ncbi:MAG: SUMF1/EgtB/PvdO family nonheme iron enzyme [Saprospirales bacterium]|nr:SUMF1/EgtB/PvdO family nonheme iron enzyme [Saprospirales bacterium]
MMCGRRFCFFMKETLFLQPTPSSIARLGRQSPGNLNAYQLGTFLMGCTEEQRKECEEKEKPVHKVTVEDFFISKHEVTNREFCVFL